MTAIGNVGIYGYIDADSDIDVVRTETRQTEIITKAARLLSAALAFPFS